MLAALPKAPSKYNPYRNVELAKFRRNLVLKNLYDNKFLKKTNRTSLQFVDEIRNILKDNFSYNKILIPNFYFDNEQIQKDQQMIYWIFKMNHFTEIDKEKYIILELINLECLF